MKNKVSILVADDDHDDCLMIKEALFESRLLNDIHFVHDGEELLDYLHQRGKYSSRTLFPYPGLILLDLNMPKVDGREALREIRGNARFQHIPVVVLTTSQVEEDILRSYDIGANSFVTKPVAFKSLVEVMKDLGRCWLEIVELPETPLREIE